MTSREVSLKVNGAEIELSYFVQGFIDHVVSGMMATLEGTADIKKLTLTISGEVVAANLNGEAVKLNPFVTRVIRNTVTGMVSSLKGVSQAEDIEIQIAK